MKMTIRLSLGFALLTLSIGLFAQSSPTLRAEVLAEKIRDPQLRHAVLEALHLPTTPPSASREVEVGGGAEPYIAIDPNDPSRMALSYMDPQLNFPIYWSNDGGFTWNLSSFDCLEAAQDITTGQLLGGGDPVMAFDANGRLHLTYIYLLGSFAAAEFTVYYAYSDDLGANFQMDDESAIVHTGDLVNFDLIDRQWLAVDHSDGPYSGTVYMSGAYFGNTLDEPGEIILSLSPSDTQFGNAVTVHTAEGTQYGNVEVDGEGNVHLSCMGFTDPDATAGEIIHAVSSDGGATWTKTVIAADVPHPDFNNPSPTIHGRENTAVSMGAHGSDLIIVWCSFGDNIQAWMSRSGDNGVTWSEPVAFGEELFTEDLIHFMPAVALHWNRATIGWYVIDPETLESDYYIVESEDGGISWGEPQLVSSGSTDFTADTDFDFFGDYNTAAKYSCNSYHAWSDGQSGSPVVYVVKYDGCSGAVHVSDMTPVGHAWQLGQLYPNPVSDQVNLPFAGQLPTTLDLEIYTQQGRRVSQQTIQPENGVLYVGDLAAGVYVVRVKDDSGVFVVRSFIKR